ncbi:MAG: tetratricopeptide repeat protein, partial [bacterium]|nr:tetratricopeptide repeat protein [bacterium]
LDLNPKDHILAYNVGEIFFSNNKTEEAIRYFNQAATIKPDWGQPHLKIGYAYLNSADYKNAIAAFKKFLELDPQSKEAPAIKDVIKSLKDL